MSQQVRAIDELIGVGSGGKISHADREFKVLRLAFERTSRVALRLDCRGREELKKRVHVANKLAYCETKRLTGQRIEHEVNATASFDHVRLIAQIVAIVLFVLFLQRLKYLVEIRAVRGQIVDTLAVRLLQILYKLSFYLNNQNITLNNLNNLFGNTLKKF